jgi:hypothetical protein
MWEGGGRGGEEDPIVAVAPEDRRKGSVMRRLLIGLSVAGLFVGLLVGPARAASQGRTAVARISGGGTAEMQAPGLAQGISHWGVGATLYSDGTASGHFDCVDQQGGNFPGNIFGEVTSWSMEGTTVVLNVVGKFVGHGGHPEDVSFTVKIQQFGGPGVGRWTLEVGPFLFCVEVLTSGRVAIRWE